MNYNKLQKILILFAGLLLFSNQVKSQQTDAFYASEKQYRFGVELFSKEKYSAAAKEFTEFLNHPGDASAVSKINASYYIAVCSIELFHPDAQSLIEQFIESYPESIKARIAVFQAGKLMYRQKKYKPAIRWFEKTDVADLNNEEISEYYFKMGYSYLMTGDYDNAARSFAQIMKVDSKYKTAAQYYYAHVNYQKGNLNTSLEAFEKLKDSESFGPVVPYYIIQIYYEQKRYDDLLKYSQTIAGRQDIRNSAEINRYVAESYYRKGDYNNALKLFEDFEKNYPRLSREDYYQLAICYYNTKNYNQAIVYFEKVTNLSDAMQQNAYFNLGDCFLKTDKKQNARSSFQFASKSTFDPAIQEEALFNYAKLSAELNFQPVAINTFNDFIKMFPQSKHIDEANEIVAQLYITTRNYKDALTALDKIKSKSPKARAAYQKVAYFRGVEYFNDRDYDTAINLFTKAIVADENEQIKALAIYWKAEAIYNQAKFDAAIKQYRIYVFNPKSVGTEMYNTANYNIGYCYFKLENYEEANTWFRKYLRGTDYNKERLNDATIRSGDCFFMMRDYQNALDMYNTAVAGNSRASDYSMFQIGMIQGIKGNMKAKASTMSQLTVKYPKSGYAADAQYERGTALMTFDNNQEAEELFRKVMHDHPQSEYAKKSMMKLALVQYNQKNDEQALTLYKDVVKNYPGSEEAAEALTGIRNIYVTSGNPQGYFDYVKNVPALSVSNGAQDSITYEAAEQLYLKGLNESASRSFDEYLQKFPQGSFVLNATFYKAECDYKKNDIDKSLAGYTYVLEQPRSLFTEKALLKAANIRRNKNECETAIELYKRLEEAADYRDNIIEAQAGLMRCYYATQGYGNAILYARKLIEGDKVSNNLITEANLISARSSLATSDYEPATAGFKAIVSKMGNSESGAEARYSIALIQYKLGNFKESQKKCFEVVNQVPSYEYWIGKSFLLLGDNYLALKDTFQAKHTYMSILENYEKDPADPEDLKAVAKEKIDAIDKSENDKNQLEIQRKEEQYIKSEGDTVVTGND
ncbi:MAG TPA: tetratricopeptide repeat protein [Bacteroidia bacterium]|nr:tetratricopeptide repeat protein [Bacteroidia bacterium]